MAVGVPLARQELVFAPVPGHEARLESFGRLRVVAGDQHDRLCRRASAAGRAGRARRRRGSLSGEST